MSDILRKYLMHTPNSVVCFARAGNSEDTSGGNGEGGSPVGIIELEDSLADATKPPELRQGRYRGEVQGVEVRTSGNSGNQYFAVKFVIPPEELGPDVKDDYPEGAILYWNRQLVPRAGDRRAVYNLKRFMEALGLDTNTTTVDVNTWMGCQARLKVGQKPWEGEMRAQIDAVEAIEGESVPSRSSARQETAEPRRTKNPTGRSRR